MIDKEFIKKLIEIRAECANTECCDCRFSIDGEYNCCFNGVPCDWCELEYIESEDSYKSIEYDEENEELLIPKDQFERFNKSIGRRNK